jgi:hypothetical protein
MSFQREDNVKNYAVKMDTGKLYSVQMINDFIGIIQYMDSGEQSDKLIPDDIHTSLVQLYSQGANSKPVEIHESVYTSMRVFVKLYAVYLRLVYKSTEVKILYDKFNSIIKDVPDVSTLSPSKHTEFVNNFYAKLRKYGKSVVESLLSQSTHTVSPPSTIEPIILKPKDIFLQPIGSIIEFIDKKLYESCKLVIGTIQDLKTTHQGLETSHKTIQVVSLEHEIYTELYYDIIVDSLWAIKVKRAFSKHLFKHGILENSIDICSDLTSVMNLLTVVRNTFISAMTSKTIVSLNVVFESEIDAQVRRLQPLFTLRAKNRYDMIAKIISVKTTSPTYLDLPSTDESIKKFYSNYVSLGLHEVSVGLHNNIEKQRDHLSKITDVSKIPDSVIRFVTDEQSRLKLISDYEEVSGNVRVYVKMRDFDIVDKPDLGAITDKLQVTEPYSWKFVKENIEITNTDTKILIKPECYATTMCKQLEFGEFYKVIPPFAKIRDSQGEKIMRTNTEVMSSYFFGVKNLCELLIGSPQQLNVTIFTYGYSGSGKTYTLFGNMDDDSDGLVDIIIKNLTEQGAKVSIDKATTLYGYIDLDENNKMTMYSKISPVNTKESVKSVFESLKSQDGSYQVDDFIKKTTNNPDSSRGFLFLKYKVEVKGQQPKTLLIVDMAGNEDPHDILIKTLPNYYLPYKEAVIAPTLAKSVSMPRSSTQNKNIITHSPSDRLPPPTSPGVAVAASVAVFASKLSKPANKTFLTSKNLTEIELYSSLIKNVINLSLTRVLGMIYEPIKYIKESINLDVFPQRLLGWSTKDISKMIPPQTWSNKVNLESGTILAVLAKTINKNKCDFFYNITMIKICSGHLKKKIPTFETTTKDLNYNMYELTLQTFLNLFTIQINDTKSINIDITYINLYYSTLHTLLGISSRDTYKVKQLNMFFNEFITYSLGLIHNNIYGDLKTHKPIRLLECKAFKKEGISIEMAQNDSLVNTLLLYEMHKKYASRIDTYDHLGIPTSLRNDKDEEDEDNVFFSQEDFNLLNSTNVDDANKLNKVHRRIIHTIDVIYTHFVKADETLLLTIETLCVLKFTIEYILGYSTDAKTAETITLLNLNISGITKAYDVQDFNKDKYKVSTNLDTREKHISELEMAKEVDKYIKKPSEESFKILQKSAVLKYMNNKGLEDYLKTKPVLTILHKPKGEPEPFSAPVSYFERIVKEGFFINQVNHELIKLLIARRNDIDITNYNDVVNMEKPVTNISTMYGKEYNPNHHLIKDANDINESTFKLTALFDVLNNILDLNNKDITQKFYMICNIRPEMIYRQGAITSLQLMQELVKL